MDGIGFMRRLKERHRFVSGTFEEDGKGMYYLVVFISEAIMEYCFGNKHNQIVHTLTIFLKSPRHEPVPFLQSSHEADAIQFASEINTTK